MLQKVCPTNDKSNRHIREIVQDCFATTSGKQVLPVTFTTLGNEGLDDCIL
jgi:hypothetical protein